MGPKRVPKWGPEGRLRLPTAPRPLLHPPAPPASSCDLGAPKSLKKTFKTMYDDEDADDTYDDEDDDDDDGGGDDGDDADDDDGGGDDDGDGDECF